QSLIAIAVLSAIAVLRSPAVHPATWVVFYSVLVFSTGIFGACILFLVVRRPASPMDVRRTFGAVTFVMPLWLVPGVLGAALSFITSDSIVEARSWLFGMVLSYILMAFVMRAMSEHIPLRSYLASAMPLMVWLLTLVTLSSFIEPPFRLYPSLLFALAVCVGVCTLSVTILFRAVSRPFKRDLNIDGIELLRAFSSDYLTGNPEPFERILGQIGVRQDLPVTILAIRDEERLVGVVVVLYVHPGPFREIGSSALPSVVVHHIEKTYGVPALVFHGTCTHQQNLTDRSQMRAVLSEIDRVLIEIGYNKVIRGPIRVESERFSVAGLIAGGSMLAIVTGAPHYTDDIALEVGRLAERAVVDRSDGVASVSVVDAHNAISDSAVSVMPGDPEAALCVNAVTRAAEELLRTTPTPFSVGLHRMVPEGIGIQDGIGPGGVAAMVIRTAQGTTALVSIDGNNMEPGFREELIEVALSEGATVAEVTTTDTHVVNAVSLSSRGYPPVGRYRRTELADAVRRAVRGAISVLRPAEIGIGRGTIRGLVTYGERGFETLTSDVVESSVTAKRVGIRLGAVSVLTSLILIALL
ncbi:MAG: DUF2070 family protein, partial [Candidatus Thorarchaeota archaeon]